jgi:hypothetical protein
MDRYFFKLITLRFHAELRQAALVEELLGVGIDEGAGRPDDLARRDDDRLHAVLVPVAVVARLPSRRHAAGLLVAAHLLGGRIRLYPLHGRAAAKAGGGQKKCGGETHIEF